jgi:hypothetical protein
MQGDGNLVLYFTPFGTWASPIWASNTAGNPGAWATMQGDGNFVVYSASNKALWATGTNPNGSHLSVQTDGNLVVYDASGKALWGSGSNADVPDSSHCWSGGTDSFIYQFCPAGTWWKTCDAPALTVYATTMEVTCTVYHDCIGDACLLQPNFFTVAQSPNFTSCRNGDGKLECSSD